MERANEKTLLSFVIPCYRSERTIEGVVGEIADVVGQRDGFDYEVVCVNDCSPDGVYDVLSRMAGADGRVKVVDLVQNRGKHAAVLAGYSYVSGEYVVNLDDDSQSPVDRLWELVDPLVADECDIATANYVRKSEALWKRLGSDLNLWVSRVMLDKPKGLRFENFSAVKRFVADEAARYENPYPFLEGLFLRVSRRVRSVDMAERGRADGQASGFTFWKSVSLFANGFTNFSVKPLRIAIVLGVAFALAGFAYGAAVVARKLLVPSTPIGWSSIMAVMLFSSGMLMMLLGLIGEYVGRIFICINNPPQYVVRRTINLGERGGHAGD